MNNKLEVIKDRVQLIQNGNENGIALLNHDDFNWLIDQVERLQKENYKLNLEIGEYSSMVLSIATENELLKIPRRKLDI
jgi:ribosomal protein L10